MAKERILSGIQPSGDLHIGAYAGAIMNWVELQHNFDPYFCIVDLHAITVDQDPEKLHKQTIELAKLYIACGIDPKHATIFVQSQVPQHAELAWILNSKTYMGELKKMTQFKDKSGNDQQAANVGLFSYPVLMAADILLYQANLVPVGEDQIQHMELTRDIAKRFNNKYTPDKEEKQLFTVPEVFVPEKGARIKGLQDPKKKMSKSSENKNDIIYILDDAETIRKKINKSVTDNENDVRFAPTAKPGISNLLSILAAFEDKSIEDVEKECKGMQYGEFKAKVADTIIAKLTPIQEKYATLSDHYILEILHEHAQKAREEAQKTVYMVYDKLGFVR